MTIQTPDDIRIAVREQYGTIARGGGSCGTGCCGPGAEASRALGYSAEQVAAVPEGANMGLGCGNPQAIAALVAGETVLDLGAGGGFDCFLAARQVGPSGHVIGVDMTADMVLKARANAKKLDARNVDFRLGEIERLPVADRSVDVILSNCVINLSPDKATVFQEAKLRPFVARRVGNPVDVDDVLQDVFLRMQRGLGVLRDEQRFGPWVYQVARNAIIDHRRVAARHPLAASHGSGQEDWAASDDAGDGEDGEVEREVASYIAPFVAMLPSPHREALTLTELQGITQKQAAEMLGISLSGAKSRVQRGRAHLRRALEDCCHIALDPRGRVIGCDPRPDGKLPRGCCELEPITDASRSCRSLSHSEDNAGGRASGNRYHED